MFVILCRFCEPAARSVVHKQQQRTMYIYIYMRYANGFTYSESHKMNYGHANKRPHVVHCALCVTYVRASVINTASLAHIMSIWSLCSFVERSGYIQRKRDPANSTVFDWAQNTVARCLWGDVSTFAQRMIVILLCETTQPHQTQANCVESVHAYRISHIAGDCVGRGETKGTNRLAIEQQPWRTDIMFAFHFVWHGGESHQGARDEHTYTASIRYLPYWYGKNEIMEKMSKEKEKNIIRAAATSYIVILCGYSPRSRLNQHRCCSLAARLRNSI